MNFNKIIIKNSVNVFAIIGGIFILYTIFNFGLIEDYYLLVRDKNNEYKADQKRQESINNPLAQSDVVSFDKWEFRVKDVTWLNEIFLEKTRLEFEEIFGSTYTNFNESCEYFVNDYLQSFSRGEDYAQHLKYCSYPEDYHETNCEEYTPEEIKKYRYCYDKERKSIPTYVNNNDSNNTSSIGVFLLLNIELLDPEHRACTQEPCYMNVTPYYFSDDFYILDEENNKYPLITFGDIRNCNEENEHFFISADPNDTNYKYKYRNGEWSGVAPQDANLLFQVPLEDSKFRLVFRGEIAVMINN